jgi:hypothetical protein
MSKNKVNDPITDQEIAFALLVLSGGMTDRQAAEAVGLNPDSAAYIKSKPTVRAYMLQHRPAVEQQLVQQEAGEQHRLKLDREKVLARLWEMAYLSPEITRGSITGQVKALTMIVAMENFIPDRRSVNRLPVSLENKSTPAPITQTHTAAWLARHPAKTSQSTAANRVTPSEAPKTVPLFNSVPDLGIPFSIKKEPLNPFVHPR